MTLRDGTLYFLALLLLNALSIAGWLNNVFVDASGFSIPLSSIIISHFLLNLRQIANVPMGGDNSASAQDEELDGVYSHISTPVLSSFLGNMGELLDDHHETDMIDVMWKEADGVQHDAKHARVDHHAACNALDHHVTLADGQPSIGQGHSKPVAIVTA
ncbi:hypothetical protein CERSUDRAFT_116312 [Gelatoporia subvermispora B]|uniref:Uncharacterized protein n=1 Tax=Ceriporiopsis subvermispora (strain B) TaxID=914234 RepID=M2PHM7_CERS8|nr:hypothetical protein CERSUDRAFT_116312 [Gelatoporia subvermispora B]